MTAHRCLFADGGLCDAWVLVQGGAGAVGFAAALLAKWAGARVVATVSRPEQARVLKEAGADLILNRKVDDIPARVREATGGAGVARIVDVSLVDNLDDDLACLAPNGVIAAYAADTTDAVLRVPFLRAMLAGAVLRFVYVYGMPAQAHLVAASDINAALSTRTYRPVIGLRLPLDNIAKAHDAQDSGAVIGKIVLDLA
jgi:NADPH:quinone reductase